MFQLILQGQATIPMTAAMQNKSTHAKSEGMCATTFVMSGRGAWGRASVTVNLCHCSGFARFYGRHPDVDIHGPSVPRLLGASASVMADENGKYAARSLR